MERFLDKFWQLQISRGVIPITGVIGSYLTDDRMWLEFFFLAWEMFFQVGIMSNSLLHFSVEKKSKKFPKQQHYCISQLVSDWKWGLSFSFLLIQCHRAVEILIADSYGLITFVFTSLFISETLESRQPLITHAVLSFIYDFVWSSVQCQITFLILNESIRLNLTSICPEIIRKPVVLLWFQGKRKLIGSFKAG